MLDVATGTGLVAAELLGRGFSVTGSIRVPTCSAVRGSGSACESSSSKPRPRTFPYAGSFDHLTVTYLLRYVADPAGHAGELARVVRPGGVVASLEFGLPTGLARPAWELYVRAGLPLAGRFLRHGWSEVGDFLGGSIREYWEHYPLERQLELWAAAGLAKVSVRRMSLGGGVVIWGSKK